MANQFIDTFTEETQDKLTKSMLECSILFSLSRNPSLNKGRTNMFLQCVFAIVSSETQEWTPKLVHDAFLDRFSKEYDIDLIKKSMQKLLKEGLLTPSGPGYIAHRDMAEKIKEENVKIERRTKELFDFVIGRVENLLTAKLTEEERTQMETNVRNTFNLYVRMYGFESFVNNEISSDESIVEDEDIIKEAIKDLPEDKGEILVGVLSELMEHPTREQAMIMMLWVKVYLGTQVMRLDPQLSQLEKENLKGKKFILDTDFLLYCLVEHPKQSKGYRRLLKILRKAGCQLIIPEEVVIEVLKHAHCAESNYRKFTRLLKAVTRDVIEKKANNVFVKDYCLYNFEAKHHQTIRQYMNNNFISDDEPLTFMKQLIYDQLRLESGNDEKLEVSEEYLPYQEELTKKILARTRYADNDKWRTEDEMQTLSQTDARLYLSVLSLNKDVKDAGNGEMLRSKAYLVTGTTKSIKSALEMNIYRNFVTRPELLINLLAEIGEFDDTKQEFVDLFDNPFLAHIINNNWEMIRNLSEVGLNMHDKNITILKRDLGEVYHRYLTKDADVEVIDTTTNFDVIRIRQPKDFFEFAQEVNRLNYQLVPEMQMMVDEYKEETSKRMTAEEKQKIAERLLAQKAHGYEVYLSKRESKSGRKNLGYKKNRK